MAIKYMGGNYAVVGDGLYFGGSSLLTCVEGRSGFFTVAPKFAPLSRSNGHKMKVNRQTAIYEPHVSLHECLPHSVIFTQKQEQKDAKKRSFAFNKKALFTRALVFSELRQSKEFLAFYTISFPEGTNDVVCRRALHTLLVRLKESFGLNGYVLVCERQQNGTLHFHLLVNDYMPVRYSVEDDPNYLKPSVNSFLQVTLYHLGVYETIDDARRYNGVDVEKVVSKSKRYNSDKVKSKVLRYLIKYVSKGDKVKWDFRPWRCSHSVSCLFTSAYINHLTSNLCDVEVEYNMWATVYRWKKQTKQPALELAYLNMCRLNSVLYDVMGALEKQNKVAEFIFDNQKDGRLFFRIGSDGLLHNFGGSLEFGDDDYIGSELFDSTLLLEEEPDFDDGFDYEQYNCPF